MNMIEQVARALCKLDRLDPDEDPNYVSAGIRTTVAFPPEARLWWRYKRQARAAIEAMREPTEAMDTAADKEKLRCNSDFPSGESGPAIDPSGAEYWHAMIEAALAHSKTGRDQR